MCDYTKIGIEYVSNFCSCRRKQQEEKERLERERREEELREEQERAKKGGKRAKQHPSKVPPVEAKSSRPESAASTTLKEPSVVHVLGGPTSVLAASGVSIASMESK